LYFHHSDEEDSGVNLPGIFPGSPFSVPILR
jgi:hypothetical protein